MPMATGTRSAGTVVLMLPRLVKALNTCSGRSAIRLGLAMIACRAACSSGSVVLTNSVPIFCRLSNELVKRSMYGLRRLVGAAVVMSVLTPPRPQPAEEVTEDAGGIR